MKRKTRNRILLEVVKRQENEIASLLSMIAKLGEKEQMRDDAWERHVDLRIKRINTVIRTAKDLGEYKEKLKEVFG